MTIVNTTDENFAKTIEGNLVLIDFWAAWCSPCKVIAPILESISQKMGDKIIIGKHNIDSEPSVPVKYNVRSIPTLCLFSKSELIGTQIGATNENHLLEFIEKHKKS